eukprot:3633583-Rhodomonas_salina.1
MHTLCTPAAHSSHACARATDDKRQAVRTAKSKTKQHSPGTNRTEGVPFVFHFARRHAEGGNLTVVKGRHEACFRCGRWSEDLPGHRVRECRAC